MFMKMMVDNESYSNLFSLIENDQGHKMFNLNSDSEDEDNGESTPIYGKSKNWRTRPLNMWNGQFQFFLLNFVQI